MNNKIKSQSGKKKFENVLPYLQNSIIILSIIGTIALLLRLNYFPYDIPLVLDSLNYFWYSNDLSITGIFPRVEPGVPTSQIYHFPNNGWPIFLSLFFSIFESENFLELMNLQRLVSITISVTTIIPLYFLCKKFFNKKLAILGTVIFAFHPLIIKNSLLGITEPLFILLGTITICLFLSKNYKIIFVSFIVAALFTLVRYEGLIIFLPLSIMYILKYRKKKNIFFKYSALCIVFILILLPMAYIRTETIGHDGIISNVFSGSKYFVLSTIENDPSEQNSSQNFLSTGLINLLKFSGIFSLPYLIFLVPFGLIKTIKNKNFENYTLLAISFSMILVALYAYSRDFQETRYLLILTPILSVFSLYILEKILLKSNKNKITLIVIFMTIVFSSWFYLELTKDDIKYEHDAYEFGKIVFEKTHIINGYHPQDQYLRPIIAHFSDEFPKEKKFLPKPIKLLNTQGFDSITSYINTYRENGLEYIVVDDLDNRPDYLRQIYFNENKFPYLKKVYDSNSFGSSYKVKLFLIDYSEYDKKYVD